MAYLPSHLSDWSIHRFCLLRDLSIFLERSHVNERDMSRSSVVVSVPSRYAQDDCGRCAHTVSLPLCSSGVTSGLRPWLMPLSRLPGLGVMLVSRCRTERGNGRIVSALHRDCGCGGRFRARA